MKSVFAISAALERLHESGQWLSSAAVPGRPKRLARRILEASAALFQRRSPLRAMNLYLDGFHFFSDDLERQVEAHHFCTQLNEDFYQAVIFDGNSRKARLIGVEYIVSERLFRALPEDEKPLWHSHRYEVTSGALVAPGLPQLAELPLMGEIVTTYGKAWHTWDPRRHALPLGIPALMMAFTADGQLDPDLVARRDARLCISTRSRRRLRESMPAPDVLPGVDVWESGCASQLQRVESCVRGTLFGESRESRESREPPDQGGKLRE